ncbi:hypothetical protein MKY95_10270 [Paenibacillus sp. FSL P4-0176]|uniref:hypothetical protein n=1 Tax=Paenibacillus sp. FSL P4-0176 TaxID=2921631 RepID=UPI0030D4E4CD
MKPWQIILAHFYLDDSKRINRQPRHFNTEVFEYDNKNEAIREYTRILNEYDEKSYDMKGHSMAAHKAYHELDGDGILTNILLHFNGEEYDQLSDEEIGEATK